MQRYVLLKTCKVNITKMFKSEVEKLSMKALKFSSIFYIAMKRIENEHTLVSIYCPPQ